MIGQHGNQNQNEMEMRQFVRCKYFSMKIKGFSFCSLLVALSGWTYRTCFSLYHLYSVYAYSINVLQSLYIFSLRNSVWCVWYCVGISVSILSHMFSSVSTYPFPMSVVFRAIATWRLAKRPDPIALSHWKHKLMQCISCQDVNLKQQIVPTAMWSSLVFPISWEKSMISHT